MCLPIRGLSLNSNGYQVLNGIVTDNSSSFLSDVRKSTFQTITSKSLQCRPSVAAQDYLSAKYLIKGKESKIQKWIILKLSYFTCIDFGHHEDWFHRYTLNSRKVFLNNLGFLLRRLYFKRGGIITNKIRNSRLELESNSNVYLVQTILWGKC